MSLRGKQAKHFSSPHRFFSSSETVAWYQSSIGVAKLWQHYVLCLIVCLRHSDSYVCVKIELFLGFAFQPSRCVQRYLLK